MQELNFKATPEVFKKILPAYDVLSKDELYSKVGAGLISLDNLRRIVKRNPSSKIVKYWELRFTSRNKTEKKSSALFSALVFRLKTVLIKTIHQSYHLLWQAVQSALASFEMRRKLQFVVK